MILKTGLIPGFNTLASTLYQNPFIYELKFSIEPVLQHT